MAKQKIPELSLPEEMREWAKDTLFMLRKNLKTQRVWPEEVYQRYSEINQIRKENGQWYSTGEGIKNLNYHIVDSKAETARLDFFFNDYLRFVDLGVSRWNKAEDVDRTRKARYRNRYTTWSSMKGRTHRPAMMMEFRHLQRRMGWYMREYYAVKGQAYLMKAFEGMLE